uniref:Domain of unknown function at the cortex 1 domain-containing protein n=1 Tax=Pseudo-nitzschia australis TaxID=44445 RepID=A0A7S4AQ72_9STRA
MITTSTNTNTSTSTSMNIHSDANRSQLVFEESNRRLMGGGPIADDNTANDDDKNTDDDTNTGGKRLQTNDRDQYRRQEYRNKHPYQDSSGYIPEDPTVQESIECIFASQLEDGLGLWDDDDDKDHDGINTNHQGSFETLDKVQSSCSSSSTDGGMNMNMNMTNLIPPSVVQQSRMNRKDRKNSNRSLYAGMSQTKKRYEQASLVYVGTFDPSCPSPTRNTSISHDNNNVSSVDNSLDGAAIYDTVNPLPCKCATSFLPAIEPKDWPQAPIALRPTPGSGTKVKAIRFCNSNEPLWVPGSHLTWSQNLARRWGRKYEDQSPHFACCEQCVLLPVNNGNEIPGESLVIDFESDLFEGTLFLRLRYTDGTTPEPYDDSKGYFAGVNRRYQASIRGRFKKVLPFTELHNGFRLQRQFGKLPSKWVLKSTLKVVSFFAPQLDIKLEGLDKPYSITPLGSAPQCIVIDDPDATNSLDGKTEEPAEAHRSLLGVPLKAETSLQRAKMRKKAFDKLYVQKSSEIVTDPTKIYTFEFLQHMLNFQDFTIEMGSVLGSLELEHMLNGQPLQILAEHVPTRGCLWSFDVWNECLWAKAKEHDEAATAK